MCKAVFKVVIFLSLMYNIIVLKHALGLHVPSEWKCNEDKWEKPALFADLCYSGSSNAKAVTTTRLNDIAVLPTETRRLTDNGLRICKQYILWRTRLFRIAHRFK